MHPYVELAKKTIEEYVKTGKLSKLPESLPEDFQKRAGVFVSIKKEGQLRGCIGTILPVCENLAEEIRQNAVSASARDPRFPRVKENELAKLSISVDVLGEAEKIYKLDDLDVKKYGVIVESGFKKGLLLPDIEGVDTVEEQVGIAMRKAGISPEEKINLYRFEVKRFH